MSEEIVKRDVGSGGSVERAIWFIAGCIMGILGASLAYIGYWLLNDGKTIEYEWAYATACLGFSFFLLRGAWYTIIPEKEKDVIKMSHDR